MKAASCDEQILKKRGEIKCVKQLKGGRGDYEATYLVGEVEWERGVKS